MQTVSARNDPRFATSASVRKNAIEAVVCAPIGAGVPLGVLYLQGRDGGGPFSEDAVRDASFLARHLGPHAERLLRVARPGQDDPTARWRERLRADAIVGRSAALADVLRLLSFVARLDLTVSFSGPTGTGKTLFAEVLHASSPRASAPFLEVNCAALPDNLVESELFGAERGAHSTAVERIPGKVEAAGAGTLFLDEVGDLPLASQAKLLQLLQSGKYLSLGSSTPRQARCRLVVATNRDLRALMAEGKFREDLFYRLDVFSVRVPGLAERRDDIVPMAQAFLLAAVASMKLPPMTLTAGAEDLLSQMEWPGNVRELKHRIERAAVLASADGATAVHRHHLSPDGGHDADDDLPATFQEATRNFQRALLVRTLREVDGNVSEAARRLDLARSYVYDLMTSFGLR